MGVIGIGETFKDVRAESPIVEKVGFFLTVQDQDPDTASILDFYRQFDGKDSEQNTKIQEGDKIINKK